jgi:polygalacturonase
MRERTGRIKFGTEANGGFKNITVSNCVFEGCYGLALESVDGALLEDVTINNITMRDVVVPIFMRLGARMRGPAGIPVGTVKRVIISNLVCSEVASPVCSIISGIPGHPIEDVKLSNIVIQHKGGGAKMESAVPEKEKDYPEPDMFGTTPAHGFFIRHVKGIDVSDVKIIAQSADARPAVVLSEVSVAGFSHLETAGVAFSLHDVEDFRVSASKGIVDVKIEKVTDLKI